MQSGHPMVPTASEGREERRGHRGPAVAPVAARPLMAAAGLALTGVRRGGVVASARATNALGRRVMAPPVRIAHAVNGLVLDGVAPGRAAAPRLACQPEGVTGRIAPP